MMVRVEKKVETVKQLKYIDGAEAAKEWQIGTYLIVTEPLVLTIPPYTTPRDEVRKTICTANQLLTNLLIPWHHSRPDIR